MYIHRILRTQKHIMRGPIIIGYLIQAADLRTSSRRHPRDGTNLEPKPKRPSLSFPLITRIFPTPLMYVCMYVLKKRCSAEHTNWQVYFNP